MAFAVCAAVAICAAAPPDAQSADASPAPKFDAREAAHRAKLDAALAPIVDYRLGPDDADRIRKSVEAIRGGNLSRVEELQAATTDPAAKKLITWIRLRNGYGTAAEYRAFLKDNPLWPDRSALAQRLEEELFTEGGGAASIKSHFANSEPETGLGYAALASALLAEGKSADAKKFAAKAWREMSIPASLEFGFLSRFASLLNEADHKWRFDRLVTDDVRWAGNRADRAAQAKRIIPLLSQPEQKKAAARTRRVQ